MIHTYATLNNPIAQIEAAEEFCAAIQAYIEDEYKINLGVKPPDVGEITPHNVLDALARLGLRFETDGTVGYDEQYFALRSKQRAIDACLYGYARAVAEDFEENGFIEYPSRNKKHRSVVDLITINGCVPDRLLFVPDYSGVASAAYFLILHPGTTAVEGEPKAET